jgi:hypothetical protein
MSYSNHQHVKRRYTAWNEETNPVHLFHCVNHTTNPCVSYIM